MCKKFIFFSINVKLYFSREYYFAWLSCWFDLKQKFDGGFSMLPHKFHVTSHFMLFHCVCAYFQESELVLFNLNSFSLVLFYFFLALFFSCHIIVPNYFIAVVAVVMLFFCNTPKPVAFRFTDLCFPLMSLACNRIFVYICWCETIRATNESFKKTKRNEKKTTTTSKQMTNQIFFRRP